MSVLFKSLACTVCMTIVFDLCAFCLQTTFTRLDIDCHNRDPLSSFDSTYGPYPEVDESTTDAEMSPDGRKLLTNSVMYDVEADSTWPLPVREDYQIPHWSPDGRYVYYSTTDGWYRSTPDGKDVTYLGGLGYLASPVGDSLVVQISQSPS